MAVLTALNLAGTLQSKGLQKVMEILLITALAAFAIGGIVVGRRAGKPAAGTAAERSTLDDDFRAATPSAAGTKAPISRAKCATRGRNMVKVLAGGLILVTLLYLLVNLGYYRVLGLGGLKESKAIAVDTMRAVAGDKAALLIALIVCVSALTTMNAAIFTGARTNWALGRDYRLFALPRRLARVRLDAGERARRCRASSC